MGKFKIWLAKKLFSYNEMEDASAANRDPAETTVKRVGIRLGDVTSKDFVHYIFFCANIRVISATLHRFE